MLKSLAPIMGWLSSYSAPRVVTIHDSRIGFLHKMLLVASGVVLVWQIFSYEKSFYKMGTLTGTATVSALAPWPAWQAVGLRKPQVFCTPDSVNYAQPTAYPGYTVTNTTFQLWKNVSTPRYPCQVLDANWLIPNPLEPSALFIPTRIVRYAEQAPFCNPQVEARHLSFDGSTLVTNTTETECTYAIVGKKASFYVPDIEAYTIKFDHSISVPTLDSSFTKDQMEQGKVIGQGGVTIDPCAFYKRLNPSAPCPSNTEPQANATNYISVGLPGVPDIISLGTLLEAAGVSSLDVTGIPATDSLRYGGLTLVVEINYDNFFSTDYKRVKYFYKVTAAAGKVKGIFSGSPSSDIPSPSRTTYERSGIRIYVNYAGKLGKPDWLQGWLALMSIAQAFGIATVLIGILMNDYILRNPSCFPARIYNALISSPPHDISDLSPSALKELTELLKSNPHLLDPEPAALAELRRKYASLQLRDAEGATAGAAPEAGAEAADSRPPARRRLQDMLRDGLANLTSVTGSPKASREPSPSARNPLYADADALAAVAQGQEQPPEGLSVSPPADAPPAGAEPAATGGSPPPQTAPTASQQCAIA